MRILVVDDCPDTCNIIGECLKQKLPAAEVSYAYDGDEALRRIAQTPPSLVILNIRMPGKSGFDVLEQIRAGGNNVPVLLTSATAGAEVLARGTLDDGHVQFIEKPFRWDTFVERARELLRIGASALPRAGKPRMRTRKWTWR
ncbi:MAG: response regulator [Verrucomicrobia bacterium]|nr:response regulator [Verrucomicrobiota bacterium]